MQIYQLEQFKVVAQCEHMTQAAERLHVSQPALSQSILRLEKELGVSLFERRGRQIKLNNFGHEFLLCVENVLRQLDDGCKLLSDMQNAVDHRIRVSHMGLPFLTGSILQLYLDDFPDTAIEYVTCKEQTMKQMLRAPEVDLVLTTRRPDDPEYNWMPLGQLQLELFVPQGLPVPEGPLLDLPACRNFKFIGPDHNSELRHIFEALCFSLGFMPRFCYESSDCSLMPEFSQRYQAILFVLNGIHQPLTLEQHPLVLSVALTRYGLQNQYSPPTLGVVTLKGHYLSQSARSFLAFLQNMFQPFA